MVCYMLQIAVMTTVFVQHFTRTGIPFYINPVSNTLKMCLGNPEISQTLFGIQSYQKGNSSKCMWVCVCACMRACANVYMHGRFYELVSIYNITGKCFMGYTGELIDGFSHQ